jgi:DNA uptake protein ComE-like DNA-binding protein
MNRIISRATVLGLALGLMGPGPVTAQVGTNTTLLNANLASRDSIAAIAEVDGALADAIVAGRPYMDMRALNTVVGANLSDEQVSSVYMKLWVPINLNAASSEEIELIPNLGSRMAYEFDEYRPYVALAQWRREISKYVDDAELARMEQYVYVAIDLNAASDEAILTIPGAGNRVLREFKEYRPYANMAQFNREMGKYWDEGEVSRLARYVRIGEG